MKVKVVWECDIDVSDLDEKYVDIKGFAMDEAKRFFMDEVLNKGINSDDLDACIE